MSRAGIRAGPLTPTIGAVVEGVDPTRPSPPRLFPHPVQRGRLS